MKEREIRAAKTHLNSRARMEITEKGVRAAAVLLLEQLGEVEVDDSPAGQTARRDAIDAVLLMAEVLSHGTR